MWISDHLPCIISNKINRICCAGERPFTRLFGNKYSAVLVQKMESEKWDDIYCGDGDYYKTIITVVLRIFKQSFPIVHVSRKRWKDKPWVTKFLKISIKHKIRLCKACRVDPSEHKHKRYKNYKTLLRKYLKETEIRYYVELFYNHKNYVFNPWKIFTPIIKTKKGKSNKKYRTRWMSIFVIYGWHCNRKFQIMGRNKWNICRKG